MPTAIAFGCSFPGCPNRKPCPKHGRSLRFDEGFYSSPEWRGIRSEQLAREPFCRKCKAEGKRTPANQVNHIRRRDRGGSDDPSNLESLCRPHHTRETFAGR